MGRARREDREGHERGQLPVDQRRGGDPHGQEERQAASEDERRPDRVEEEAAAGRVEEGHPVLGEGDHDLPRVAVRVPNPPRRS